MSTYKGFDKEALGEIYRKMLLSRRLDEKMVRLLRQGKGFFHIGSSGHEAATLAAATAMEHKKDWTYPYYRDMAVCLGMGTTAEDIMMGFFAKADDPATGGRQMPQHFGNADLRIVTQSSPTGTQFLPAVGMGLAIVRDEKDEVVYVSCGEGTTSQGDFHEALNWASRDKLPVLFHVEDNKYAISVHVSEQTAGSSVYDMVSGYANLERVKVDGTDFFATYEVFKQAVERGRNGQGPTAIVSDVVRLLPHSSSDDHRKYRSAEDLEADKARDPIPKFRKEVVEAGLFTDEEMDAIEKKAKEDVDKASDWAEEQPEPNPESALDHLFIDTEIPRTAPEPKTTGEKAVMVDAINHALNEEMERNEKMVVYGQDIADGKGGVFTATKGLSTKYGKKRAFNAPLAESSIVGTAIGMAMYGYKPVVEIQFVDYIWTAMMQMRNELTTVHYRSNGAYKAPVVIRTTCGGYIHGALCHSQCNEAFFTHMCGLKVCYPSNAADAKGLLKAAIRGNDPVLFLEHKALYRQGFAARPEPDADYTLPLGLANVVQEGEDITIVTWGMMVQRSIEAAKSIRDTGASVEIIDLRTLIPLDMETIINSVKKTGKVLVIHEENLTGGFGGEIVARIAADAFEYLDGPIQRIGAEDTPIPYSAVLEKRILPQQDEINHTLRELILY